MIEKIDTLELYQSFLGRLFDYGDIKIYYNEKYYSLKGVPHPRQFINFVEIFKIK